MPTPTPGSERPGEKSQLVELLECERELAELMRAAREDAARQIAEARATASTLEADLEASLGQEADRVRAAIRQRTQTRIREIVGEARARRTVFDQMTDDRIAHLAEAAFRRLIGKEASS